MSAFILCLCCPVQAAALPRATVLPTEIAAKVQQKAVEPYVVDMHGA
jgi:hypothetical protein